MTDRRDNYLPYGRQEIDEDDIAAVAEVLRSNWITTGPKISEFEVDFASRVGAEHAVALSSGTAALHAAAFAVEIGQGDEVITTPLTFAASANCVLYCGGTPVFADVREDTLNIDTGEVEARITSKTKAVIAVDFGGQPCDYVSLMAAAREHGLVLIEDAAHSLGARWLDRPVGSFADITVFSLHPVKHITTGEGGMLVTDNAEYARRARMFRNHGISTAALDREESGAWHYEMVALGYNYRITDFQCALGLSQLRKLDRFLDRRRKLADSYSELLSSVSEVELPQVRSDTVPAWHLFPILVSSERRQSIFSQLRNANIGVNVHYIPVHLHPFYRERFGFGSGDYPVAETVFERLISLPIFGSMELDDARYVTDALVRSLRRREAN